MLLNLVPRLFMLFWTLSISYFEDYLPPRAAIAGASLSVLGGDTVFNSLIYGLAAKLTDDGTIRFVTRFDIPDRSLTLSYAVQSTSAE